MGTSRATTALILALSLTAAPALPAGAPQDPPPAPAPKDPSPASQDPPPAPAPKDPPPAPQDPPPAPKDPAPAPKDPAPAPATPDPALAIEKARAAAFDLSAKRLRAAADAAFGAGLKATAAGLYRHLLEYSADDSQARTRLGWKRKNGAWEQGEAPEALDLPRAGAAEAFATRRTRELAPAAEAHAKHAALLEADGRKVEARAAYEEALRLDPSNAAACRARGDALVDGKWVRADVLGYRKLRKRLEDASRALKAAPSRAKPVAERTEGEKLLGVDLARARSPRFLGRTDGKPADAALLCDTAERTMDLLDALLGTSPTPGEEAGYFIIILANQDRYKVAVDHLTFASLGERATALAAVGTFLPDFTYVGYLIDPAWTLDLASHKAGEVFLRLRFPFASEKMWLREAMGVLGAALLLDSHETFCVETEDSGAEGQYTGKPSEWLSLLATAVAHGRDRPLKEIVGLDMTKLTLNDTRKSCTMIQWWESTKPGSTARFLEGVNRGDSWEQAAIDAFGAGLDAQDEGWRKWIPAVAAGK